MCWSELELKRNDSTADMSVNRDNDMSMFSHLEILVSMFAVRLTSELTREVGASIYTGSLHLQTSRILLH